MEDDQNAAHYQSIDIATFRQTIMEKARMGRMPDHDRTSANRRPVRSQDVNANGNNYHGYVFGNHTGSISDTPPNTPSSGDGDSSTSLDLSSSRRVKISPNVNEHNLRDSIKNAARVPNGDPMLSQISPFGHQNHELAHIGHDISESNNVDETSTENFWSGHGFTERSRNSKSPMLRNYWESNLERERTEQQKQAQFQQQRRRPFAFPKWRSNDPMTASLVASKRVMELIPKDSKIPKERIQKLEEKERQAEIDKRAIHQKTDTKSNLQKGKSLDSLNMQLDYTPWYDRQRIREAISRESIANIGATRDKFERNTPSPNYHQYGHDYSRHRAQSTTPFSQRQNRIESSYRAVTPSAESESINIPVNEISSTTLSNYPIQSTPSFKLQSPDISNNLSADHYYLLQYIKQNQSLFSDFGISIPKTLLTIANELPSIPVELTGDNRIFNQSRQSNRSPFQSPISPTQTGQTPVLHVPPTPQRNGRYVKNIQNRFRRYDMSKLPPENNKEFFQDLELHKAGDSLIAAEIRAMKEREDELRREREEREKWFNQFYNHDYTNVPFNQLRSAISYDQLSQNGQSFSKHRLNNNTNELHIDELKNGQSGSNNPIWVANEGVSPKKKSTLDSDIPHIRP